MAFGLYFSISVLPKSRRNWAFGPCGPPGESSGSEDGKCSGQINSGAARTLATAQNGRLGQVVGGDV